MTMELIQPISLEESGPLPRELLGKKIHIEVTIGYPGSRVTDLLIPTGIRGVQTVQIEDDVLRKIAREHKR